MHRINGLLIFTASDLAAYLECGHLVHLERQVVFGEMERPQRDDAAELLARKGAVHERQYLDRLRDEGREIVEFSVPAAFIEDYIAAARRTEEAMERGADVLVQATLFDGTWLGRADVLMRVPMPSQRWAWSYEVIDTKLALTTRPSAIVQICNYSEHVARVQGRPPKDMHIVLGDGTVRRYSVNSFSAYYRVLVQAFREHLSSVGDTYPLPVAYCPRCVWNDSCTLRREDDDHLSIVAWMRADQIVKLEAQGITTVGALSRAGDDRRPARLSETTFATLRRQAALQTVQRDAERQGRTDGMRYELLRPREGEGLALLPHASPGDVFFDMEGDPMYEVNRALEYLFGCYLPDDRYIAFWARDVKEEQVAFERCVDFFVERRAAHPEMHIYHYAAYERAPYVAWPRRTRPGSVKSTTFFVQALSSISTESCGNRCWFRNRVTRSKNSSRTTASRERLTSAPEMIQSLPSNAGV